jgi:hypothetical protein
LTSRVQRNQPFQNKFGREAFVRAVLVAAPLAAALAYGILAPTAVAQTRTLAQIGGWTAFGGTLNNGTPTCGVDTRDRNTGRHFLIQFTANDRQRLSMRAVRDAWQIPPGTPLPVRIAIDAHPGWQATAMGRAREVQWFVGLATLDRFERTFRAGSNMRLEFPGGNEAPWTFSLTGTNAIMNHFVACLRSIGAIGGAQPQANAPTQPFGQNTLGPPKR